MYDEILKSAIFAAKTAGYLIEDAAQKKTDLHIEAKAKNDFVTAIDKESENCIKNILRERHPDFEFMAEETSEGKHIPDTPYWVIDPIDGTTNYIHRFPAYCVSIALCEQTRPMVGVIYDPTRNELFHAVRGQGAYLNDVPISVSGCTHLSDGLIATGFPFRNYRIMKKYLRCFEEILRACQGIRRPGAAAIDLAYVACGRLDGFWEHGLHPWDAAAGVVIIEEAGGKVTDFTGNDTYLFGRTLVTANKTIHSQLQSIVHQFMPTVYPE